MLHGSIRPAAPTRPFLPAFAAAKANVPVSTVAAAAAASPVLSNDVTSPPWMNDSPIQPGADLFCCRRRGRRRLRSGRVFPASRALNVAEDQPAHCGVHVQGFACARGDPGEPVVEAEGGQA